MILLCKRKKSKVCREPRNTKKKCKSCMIVVSGCIVLCFTLCKCPFMFLYVFPYEKKKISMFCTHSTTVRHIKVISSDFDLNSPRYKESVSYN